MSSKFTNKKSNEYILTRDNWASYWHYTKVGLLVMILESVLWVLFVKEDWKRMKFKIKISLFNLINSVFHCKLNIPVLFENLINNLYQFVDE